jgi:sugar/nucleoside kinase (ribokinase family)
LHFPPSILIIGAVSLDVIHLPNGPKLLPASLSTAGGAAMYTALAAHKAGAKITLLAVRPTPMLDALQPVAARVNWLGPEILPDQIPKLEIAHYGGGNAKLLHASWGAEPLLTPDFLPQSLAEFDLVHIAALSNAARQREFLDACRARNAKFISVGVYARVVYGETETVRGLHRDADLFFMNENEARGLFGSVEAAYTAAGKWLFVTLGERGVNVHVGPAAPVHVPALPVTEFDPTGAGDTFCGTTLTHWLSGASPVEAARAGCAASAAEIQMAGPEWLL